MNPSRDTRIVDRLFVPAQCWEPTVEPAEYIGAHRPFADRGSYVEWTDMIVTGQDRDNVARLKGYDYTPRMAALVAEFRKVVGR